MTQKVNVFTLIVSCRLCEAATVHQERTTYIPTKD